MSYELEIECGAYNVIIEGKDRDVFARVKDVPEVADKEVLIAALLELLPPEGILSVSRKNADGKLCDGPGGEPGYQKFAPEKAVARSRLVDGQMKESNQLFVLEEKHYKDGKLNDTRDGTPAVQRFSESSGKLTARKHYKDGLLNDVPDGEAAVQEFDENGQLTVKGHYIDNKWNDAPNGEPAYWTIDPETQDIQIWHCTDGKTNDLHDGTPAYLRFSSDNKLIRVNYRRGGEANDTPDGIPALVEFDRKSGELTLAWRYKGGEKAEALSKRALRKIGKKPAVQALKKLHP